MTRRALPRAAAGRIAIGTLALAALAGCMPMTTTTGGLPAAREPVPRDPIAGRYAINGVRTDVVVIRKLDDYRYAVENPGHWTGVGIFDGKIYWGVFRYPDDTRHGSLTRAVGIHRAERQRDGSFRVHGSFSGDGHGLGEFDVEWSRL
jgi:hypothetical protein